MKGKLYRYNNETGKMEEVLEGELEYKLPPVKFETTTNACIYCGGEVIVTGNIEMGPSKEVMEQLLDIADNVAETLPRSKCIEEQRHIQELRDIWLDDLT